jgi:putative Ca2+/H+ antiporter (TMEM165/GDT1 family)
MTIIRGGSAFATAALSYCVAETGGKTYLMTAALSAQTGSLIPVVVGTVLGEVLINAPLIFLGQSVARRLERGQIDLTWIARAAAVLLAAMGVAELVDAMLL